MPDRRASHRHDVLTIVTTPSSPDQTIAKWRAQAEETSSASSSSSSPDSLYSRDTCTFPDPAFEYDNGEEQVQQYDVGDYESLMAESEGWQTPVMNPWQAGDWAPQPIQNQSPGGTIISISPRGSLNSVYSDREPMLSSGKKPVRRSSDAGFLGSDLRSQRSLPLMERRISDQSDSSVDTVEEGRLRTVHSMGILRRRFSDVVEVAPVHNTGRQDTYIARQLMSQWSPYTETEDESEVHTDLFTPTPVVRSILPDLLSNFPLESVAVPPIWINTPSTSITPQLSTYSSPRSPAPTIPLPPPPREFVTPPSRIFATTPPPDQPAKLLRHRVKPILARALSEYQLPLRADVVPGGAALPAVHQRSVSAPFFSALKSGEMILASRVPAVVPVQRPSPVGVSPLRSSTGGDSPRLGPRTRRNSLSMQVGDRRVNASKDRGGDLRRMTMDRRLSFEVHRMSEEGAKMSADGDKMSLAGGQMSFDGNQMSVDGRQMSMDGRQMSIDGRQMSGNGLRMSSSGDQMSVDARQTRGDGAQMSLDGLQMSGDGRQMSMDGREMSSDGLIMSNNGDQMSVDGRQMSGDGRQMSSEGDKMSADGIRMSNESRSLASFMKDGRRPSAASIKHMSKRRTRSESRKSSDLSIVSVTEYGYLAPVLDAPPRAASPPMILPEFSFGSNFTFGDCPSTGFGPFDGSAPYLFPLASPVSPIRNPVEHLFPRSDVIEPSGSHSIMDRGRPFSPPEYTTPTLNRHHRSPSPHSSQHHGSDSTPRQTPRSVAAELSPVAPVEAVHPESARRDQVLKQIEDELASERRRERTGRRQSQAESAGQIETASALVRELANMLHVPILIPLTPSLDTPRQPSTTHRRTSVDVAGPIIPQSRTPRQPTSAHRRAASSDYLSKPTRTHRPLTLPPVLSQTSQADKRKSHLVFEASAWSAPKTLSPPARAYPRVQSSYTPSQSFSPPSTTPRTGTARTHHSSQIPHQPIPSGSRRGSVQPDLAYPSSRRGSVQPEVIYSGARRGSVPILDVAPRPTSQQLATRRVSVTFDEPIHPQPSSPTTNTSSKPKGLGRFFKTRRVSISVPVPTVTAVRPALYGMRTKSSDEAAMRQRR